jgi:hypothetical protein
MARCETCGNDYDKAFQVSMGGTAHTFDSFECAIHALAPTCENCGIRIVGHGLEKDGTFFCCEHCAQEVFLLFPKGPLSFSGAPLYPGHVILMRGSNGILNKRSRDRPQGFNQFGRARQAHGPSLTIAPRAFPSTASLPTSRESALVGLALGFG